MHHLRLGHHLRLSGRRPERGKEKSADRQLLDPYRRGGHENPSKDGAFSAISVVSWTRFLDLKRRKKKWVGRRMVVGFYPVLVSVWS
jgi:hypothetical protein